MEQPTRTSVSYILYETPIEIEHTADGVGGSWRSYSWFDAALTGPNNGRPVAVFHSHDESVVIFEGERMDAICVETAVRELHQVLDAHRPTEECGFDESGEFTTRTASKYQRGVAYPIAMIRDESGRVASSVNLNLPGA